MKRIVRALALIAILSPLVHAQFSMPRQAFQIPFDFRVNEEDFPAGKYTIERINPSSPDHFVIRNTNSPVSAIFATPPGAPHGKMNMVMVFVQCGGDYRLARVTSINEKRIILRLPLRLKCPEEKGGYRTAIVRMEPT